MGFVSGIGWFLNKNLHKLDHIPERIQERVFQKLFKVASYTALSKEEKAKYEDSLIGLSSIQIAQITNRSVAEIEAILQGEGK